jgi:hypothetical protein
MTRACDTMASSPKRVRVGDEAEGERSVEGNEVSTVSGAAVMNEADEDESDSVGNAELRAEETCRLNGGG